MVYRYEDSPEIRLIEMYGDDTVLVEFLAGRRMGQKLVIHKHSIRRRVS